MKITINTTNDIEANIADFWYDIRQRYLTPTLKYVKKYHLMSLGVLVLFASLLTADANIVVQNHKTEVAAYKNQKSLSRSIIPDLNDITVTGINSYAVALGNGTSVETETVEQEAYIGEIPTYDIEVEEIVPEGEYIVPNGVDACHSNNYTYMDYKKVTSTNTMQYAVLNSDNAYTDIYLGTRMYMGDDDVRRYCIALGKGYHAPAGTYVDVVLSDGNKIHCIVGDIKATEDVDDYEMYQATDGSVVEVIVDYEYFTRDAAQYSAIFHGKVDKIIVY